ncbi:MAG: hypothetical protein P3B98_01985 [Gemmatimonadota bacterium]|nr:hypothetical protein [Gemmatimonadota bacterium]
MTARVAGLSLGDGRGVFAGWQAGGTTAPRLEPFVFNASALAAGDEINLVEALERLRRHVPEARALHVALAAPWSAPRVLGLPPMTLREARVVLARDAARYFPRVGAEPVVTARVLARGSWLACDADGVVLDAIARAGRAAGFADVRIVPAVGAWAQAVDGSAPRAFAVDGEAALVSAHRGYVTALRRLRTAELTKAMAGAPDALALAARYAPSSLEPTFESRRVATARERATTQAARRLVALGIGLLTAAAALYGWGATHRADAIETQRAALRPTLAAPLAAHDSLWQLTESVAAVRDADRTAPKWLRRLDALATALPEDAYFTVVRGSGDSVVVEGRADDAAAAVTALRSVRGAAVRALTPPATDDDLPAFAAVVHFGRTVRP